MVRFAARPETGGGRLSPPSPTGSYGARTPGSPVEQRIVTLAESWIGTPYRYAGTTRSGIDCSALMVNIFSEIGIRLPRTSTEQYASGATIQPGDLAVGDLVFFDINGAGISHVGVYVGANEFIHASLSAGVIRESLLLPYYSGRFAGARRILSR